MASPPPGPRRVYLDHAATTPARAEVLEAMAPYFSERFGNASSLHAEGREAREALEQARERIRSALGAVDHDLHFTSGGTEANNTALAGVLLGALESREEPERSRRRTLVTSEVEHPSVLAARGLIEALGGSWREVAPTSAGRVDVERLADSIRDDTLLVSLQWANNEVGALQPITEALDLARSRGAWLHSDAVQALGKVPIDLGGPSPDLLTISAHKISGPKSVGGLLVRRGVSVRPLLRGGSQEGGLRAGTESVALAVGFACAVELALKERDVAMIRLGRLRDQLLQEIQRRWPEAAVNSEAADLLPTVIHLSFPRAEGESLVKLLDWHGVAASTGSACNAGSGKPSHVLRAMGRSDREVRGSLRLSLGACTRPEDVALTIAALEMSLRQLESISPH